jgi:EAL domain-containing protein (putative c-di-GMP-specific phosphodiesterase class I)/GGDEF domain-containing protein
VVHLLKNEEERLALLRSLDLSKIADLPELRRLTVLACQIFGVPTSLISVVGEDRQEFVARHGFEARFTERTASICASAIDGKEILEVEDLLLDERFSSNRLVVGPPKMRFYAGAPLVTESGYVIGTLCLIDYVPRKLTEEQRDQLKTLAALAIDQLTLLRSVGRREPVSGLPNRQQFTLDLGAIADTHPHDRQILTIFDVFDVHNAHILGQARGMAPVESIIRQVGERISKVMEGVAPLYHVGVSRFAFVIPDLALDERTVLLERIEAATVPPVLADGLLVQPMCHGGITTFDGTNVDDALRRAIVAMHQALDGRLSWVKYEPTRDIQLRRDYLLASDLSSAIKADHLYLVYQPRVDLVTGSTVGVEALLRWKHHELGEVSPSEFIPVIERTALMSHVTDWVIQHALIQLRSWLAQGLNLVLSVNVTPSDFRKGDLAERIRSQIFLIGVPASNLEIEITEGEWLERTPEVSRQLSEISQLGVRIAVDDFGAGYSNFAYLTSLPIDTIKIDRSLVSGFTNSPKKAAMVRSIVGLATDLEFRIVAEGVETEQEVEGLCTIGCKEAQGYIFSRPMLASELFRNTRIAA